MLDEEKAMQTVQEKLRELQQQNLVEGQAEINAILERRGLTLVGVPQFTQGAQGWQIVVSVGVVHKAGDS